MKIKLNDIKLDHDIYPRTNISKKTTDSYAEALSVGAKFPPVLLQRISIEDEGESKETTIVIDGAHRVEAYKAYNKFDGVEKFTEIDSEFYRDEVLDKVECLHELRVTSIKRNLSHGDRLSNADKQAFCIKMAEEDKDITITETDFAEIFGVAQQSVNNWIKELRAGQKSTRNSFIYKLGFEGWGNQEIGGTVGLTEGAVRAIRNNTNFGKITDEYKKGKSVDAIAEYYGLETIVVWAILLQDKKDDTERFKLFGKSEYSNDKPKIYDVWNFMKKDPRFSTNYPGFCFGQVLMNVLYYWSSPNDLIIDPMAGGGSTIDTCLIMSRKCRAYDIKPIREDILENDIRNGYPPNLKEADLVFLDPPYHKKKEEDYNCPEIYASRESHLTFLENLSKHTYSILKKGGYTAFLYSNYLDYDNEENSILTPEIYGLFNKAGFKGVSTIQTPLNGSVQYQPHDVDRARKKKQILEISRDLYVFKKV